jgi:hypothetical protein
MEDEAFLRALESCLLPASEFGHAAHVRAAYLYLRGAELDVAIDNVRRTLQRYVAHLGCADRYDETMTKAYMAIIHRRMVEKGDAGGWAAFARANQDLFTIRRLTAHASLRP